MENQFAAIHTSGLAVPSTFSTTIEEIKSSNRMAEITIPIIMPNVLQVILTRILSRKRFRLRLRDSELHIHDGNRRLQIDFPSTPFQSIFPTKPYEISRPRSNVFQVSDDRTGIPTTAATSAVLEVQERSTVRFIRHLKRLAAADAPGDKFSSGLRER
jgi:hypothetical protein